MIYLKKGKIAGYKFTCFLKNYFKEKVVVRWVYLVCCARHRWFYLKAAIGTLAGSLFYFFKLHTESLLLVEYFWAS